MIAIQKIETPLGDMWAGAVDEGICLLEFHDIRLFPKESEKFHEWIPGDFHETHHPHLVSLKKQLNEYFNKQRLDFDLPLHFPASPFQMRVWDSLLTIPFGKTISYAAQAEKIGDKKAIRAMAKANGDNRIAILIPCHRVIGSNGDLTGYAGELWRKKALLELEGSILKQGELF